MSDEQPASVSTARVRRAIDGDTLELDQPDPTGTYPYERVRLLRVNAPELDDKSAEVRSVARAGQRFLRTLLVGLHVQLEGDARDKFHRRLARVTVDIDGEPHDVERLLVAAGLARWWADIIRERREAPAPKLHAHSKR